MPLFDIRQENLAPAHPDHAAGDPDSPHFSDLDDEDTVAASEDEKLADDADADDTPEPAQE